MFQLLKTISAISAKVQLPKIAKFSNLSVSSKEDHPLPMTSIYYTRQLRRYCKMMSNINVSITQNDFGKSSITENCQMIENKLP